MRIFCCNLTQSKSFDVRLEKAIALVFCQRQGAQSGGRQFGLFGDIFPRSMCFVYKMQLCQLVQLRATALIVRPLESFAVNSHRLNHSAYAFDTISISLAVHLSFAVAGLENLSMFIC
jgi:hypothetical protein